MRILFLMFLALCLAVIITIILASFNLIYLIWYISAFLTFVAGIFWLREVLVDRQKDQEDGKRMQQHWWRKDNPVHLGTQLLAMFVAFLGFGIIKLGATSPPLPFDYFIAIFGGFILSFPILAMFGVFITIYDSMKRGGKSRKT